MNALNKKRIIELDMVKGFAIISVFFRHMNSITGVSSCGGLYPALFRQNSEALMAAFILISGYVFSGKGTLGEQYKKNVLRLLKNYLIYTAVIIAAYFAVYVIPGNMSVTRFLQNALTDLAAAGPWNLFAENERNILYYGVVPYWYITELITGMCLFIPLNRYTSGKPPYFRYCCIALLLLTGMAFYTLDLQGMIAHPFSGHFTYFFVLPNIFVFCGILMLGNALRAIRFFEIDGQNKGFIATAGAISLAVAVFGIVTCDNSYALQLGKWGPFKVWSIPITAFEGVCVTYLLVLVFRFLKRLQPVEKVMVFLGQNTLEILMTHFLVADLLTLAFGRWHDYLEYGFPRADYSALYAFLITVLTAVIILSFIFIKRKITLARSRQSKVLPDKT